KPLIRRITGTDHQGNPRGRAGPIADSRSMFVCGACWVHHTAEDKSGQSAADRGAAALAINAPPRSVPWTFESGTPNPARPSTSTAPSGAAEREWGNHFRGHAGPVSTGPAASLG